MFREIRRSEKNLVLVPENKKKEHYEYLNIKPETSITVSEANDFINSLFEKKD